MGLVSHPWAHFVIMFFLPYSSRPFLINGSMTAMAFPSRKYIVQKSTYLISYQYTRSFVSNNKNDNNDKIGDNAPHRDESNNDSTWSSQRKEPMAHLYQEWTLEQDKVLWEHRKQSIVELASLLGRGLRGVQARLSKLQNVDSPAYERLFATVNKKVSRKKSNSVLEDVDDDDDDENYNNNNNNSNKARKLIPVSEVLRRIQWDYRLNAKDFSLLYYDRVEDTIVESRLDAPNTSIKGSASLLLDALPEHRIVAIKYKERIVWDREKRLDLVFGGDSGLDDENAEYGGGGGGIYDVIDGYDEWLAQRNAAIEWNRRRLAEVSQRVEYILGSERYAELKALSKELQWAIDDDDDDEQKGDMSRPVQVQKVEAYVKGALQLFRNARQDRVPSSLDPTITFINLPRTDLEAMDVFSELVALLPDSSTLRPMILTELSLMINRLEGGKKISSLNSILTRDLPELNEEDLSESFVRGSGPGGQKINKTNNRVVLVHLPTGLRVECQETRSLSQNRKLARKRLRLKLDEYMYGNQSKASAKDQKASIKKAKAKARSRARQRKRSESNDDDE